MKVRLTHQAIRTAEYRGKGSFYLWDTETTGFGVEVFPSGKRKFLVTYQARGKRRFLKLGEYGELTIEQAREAAWKILARVRKGEDPTAGRGALGDGPTVEDLAERYMTDHAEIHKKINSISVNRSAWKNHLLPRLATLKVAEVTHAHVAEIHADLADQPCAANNVLSTLSAAFQLAETWGWRSENSNPCRHVKRYATKGRERYLTPQELERLSGVLAEAEEKKSVFPSTIPAIRLLILTGCRHREVTTLRWDDVDLERGFLHLPDSKTGKKSVRLHRAAIEVLRGIERVEESPWVFPGQDPSKHIGALGRSWRQIRREAGIEDVRLHDLRHSFASFALNSGVSLAIISKLLGHRKIATTARYAHLDDAPVCEANEKIGARLAALLEGKA